MDFFLRLDIGDETFTAYTIKIKEDIMIPYEYSGMDLTPKKVTNSNWVQEYQKALYKDTMSPYYSKSDLMNDLEEPFFIGKGDIIIVLDTEGHFLGKINYDYNEKRKLMRVMYLYVCGKRRDYFYSKKIKNYPRGAFVVWAAAAALANAIDPDAKVIISNPRRRIFKHLQLVNAKFVYLDYEDGRINLIKAIPKQSSDDEIKELNKHIYDDESFDGTGAFITLENIMSALNAK